MKLSVRYWRGPDAAALDLGTDDRGNATFEEALARDLAAHLMTEGLAVCVELRTTAKDPPNATCVCHPITRQLVWLK